MIISSKGNSLNVVNYMGGGLDEEDIFYYIGNSIPPKGTDWVCRI